MFNRSCSSTGDYTFSGVEQLEVALHPGPGIWSALSHPVELVVIAAIVIYTGWYVTNRMPDLWAAFSQFKATP